MLSKRISNLNPYVPGEQPKDRIYIKLNANENPYPPSKEAIVAIKKFVDENPMKLALYPDPDSFELRKAIASHLNQTGGCMNDCSKLPFEITPEMIFCGNGSDEVLSFVFYTFFDSDKKLIAPTHTYSFYPVYCGFYQIPLTTVDLKDDFTLDTEKMLSLANEESSSGMIFANPNAPTSLALSVEQIRTLLKDYPEDKVFVIDEAYTDFSDESCLSLLNEFKNLVIVRTFSKSMCFAGQRLGYCLANPELIGAIERAKNSFNHFPVDAVTQVAAMNSCFDTKYYIEQTKKVVATRNRFCKFLKENGWFFYPSKTNFVLTKKEGFSGEEIYQFIKKEGVLVRHFSTPLISEYVRITIGTDEQMDELMRIMKMIH